MDANWVKNYQVTHRQPDRSSFSSDHRLALAPRVPGTYEIEIAPKECLAKVIRRPGEPASWLYPHHHDAVIRLDVRPIKTNDDKASIRLAVAVERAYVDQDCTAALAEVKVVEALTRGFVRDVLAIRAECALRSGRLSEALVFYEALDRELVRALGSDGGFRHESWGVSGKIGALRAQIQKADGGQQ